MHSSLISLQLAGQFYGVSINTDRVANEYESFGEISLGNFVFMAKNEGITISTRSVDFEELVEYYSFPIMVKLKDGTYGVILKVNTKVNEVSIYYAHKNEVVNMSFEKMNRQKKNYLILHLSMYSEKDKICTLL